MTPVEQSLLPKMDRARPTTHLASPKSDSFPSVFDRFYEPDECLYEVQEIVDKLKCILV